MGVCRTSFFTVEWKLPRRAFSASFTIIRLPTFHCVQIHGEIVCHTASCETFFWVISVANTDLVRTSFQVYVSSLALQ